MNILRNKKALIATIIIALLLIAFAILLPIYLKSNEENREIYEEQKIRILNNDVLVGEYTLEEIMELSPAVEFQAIFKPNNALPIEKTYTGIYLKDLLVALDIDLVLTNSVQFKAMDGVQKIYTANDVLEENNVYIAFKVEGQLIKEGIGKVSGDDGGPFVVIKAKDTVSKDRVKLLTEINIK